MTIDEKVAEQIIAVGQNTPQVYDNGKRQGKSEGKAEGYTEGYIKGNTDGYDAGHSDGYTEGYDYGHIIGYEEGYGAAGFDAYNAGVNDGREQGKQAEREAHWKTLQIGGAREEYRYQFTGNGYTDDNFNPIYPIRCVGTYAAEYLFASNTVITDTKVPIQLIGARGDYCFRRSRALKRIVELYCESVPRFVQCFEECNDLEELNVTGTIEVDGFDVHWSTKLNRASHESIVAALSTTTTGLTVTFSLAAVNKAFETSEGANDGSTSAEWEALKATRPNWGIGLA